MKPCHWGILGLDCIADEFADHLKKNNRSCRAASDDSKKRSRFSQEHPDVTVYADRSALLRDPEVEIVYVSSFGTAHDKDILDCLSHGKHVLCEKAMFSTGEQARRARRLAEEKHLFLGEAMTIFYMPLYEKIRELIARGTLGEIKMLRADFGSLKDPQADAPLFSAEDGGGAMYDIGSYALTFVLSFLSAPPCKETFLMNFHGLGVDETFSLYLKNPLNELANVNLCFRAKLPKRALIAGDNAYIQIFDYPRADRADLVYPDGTVEKITAGESSLAVTYEILGAENAVRSGDYRSGRMDVTESAAASMESFLAAARTSLLPAQ